MSLEVTEEEIARAHAGILVPHEFISIIKRSLPDAWELVHDLVHDAISLGHASVSLGSQSENVHGQILRMVASTSMRNAVVADYAGGTCGGGDAILALEVIDGTLMCFLNTEPGRFAHTSACSHSVDRIETDFPHILNMAHTPEHQQNPAAGVTIAEPMVLTEKERHDILRVMGSSPLREALAHSFGAGTEAVFVNCHMMALLQYPTEEVRKRLTSSLFQVLSQRPEMRHC